MTWPDGRRYVGQFDDGKPHGIGVYTAKNAKPRKARFDDGKKVEWLD